MGLRAAWALLSASVSLGFIASCATQASDAPAGGNTGGDSSGSGGTPASGAGSGNGGSVSDAGLSAAAGQSAGGLGGADDAGASGMSSAGASGRVGAAGNAG